MYDYGIVIIGSWLVFLTVWIIAAFGAKRDVANRTRGIFWMWRIILFILAILLIKEGGYKGDILDQTIFPTGITLGWIGAILTIIGIAFAIWARFYLGRNWSSHPTHKEHHELVIGGPYTFVRHPIYTGMIVAFFGSALTGSIFSIVIFVILSIVFYLRIDKEEKIMLGLFPDQYPAYQKRTKRLIPFIW